MGVAIDEPAHVPSPCASRTRPDGSGRSGVAGCLALAGAGTLRLPFRARVPVSAPDRVVSLVRHPTTPCASVRTLDAHVGEHADGLALRFVLTGGIAGLRVPPAGTPHRADRLWEHTCFEAFVATADGRYHEFNFAPSRAWAAYGFDRYRARSDWTCPVDLHADVTRTDDRIELSVVLPRAALPAGLDAASSLALTAVVESADGSIAYWALRHPPGRPDFHHPDGFALALDPATFAAVAS